MAEMTDHEWFRAINKTLTIMLNTMEEITHILIKIDERITKLEELQDAQSRRH